MVFTVGIGLTVIVYVEVVPVHPLAVGIIEIVPIMGLLPELVVKKDGTIVVPLAIRPIAVLLLVQLNVVPVTGPDMVVAEVVAPVQYA